MKIHVLGFAASLLVLSCNTATDKNAGMAKTDSSQPAATAYAYPVAYSSDFEIGSDQYKKTVLDLWKMYETNDMDKGLVHFADSVNVTFADGMMFNGSKDTLLAMVKRMRGSMTSVVDSVEAIVSLKPKGKDVTWVCIWGKEISAGKDGKKTPVFLNENWMFNKDGKVAVIHQLASKMSM